MKADKKLTVNAVLAESRLSVILRVTYIKGYGKTTTMRLSQKLYQR